MRNYLSVGFFAGMMSLSGGVLAASDFDFSGTFTSDNDILLLDFSVGSESDITIFSSSWISGDSGLGFDPILAIWDSNGGLVEEQDDGENEGSTMSNGVSYNHGSFDSYFTVLLAAGDYTASIAQYDNFSISTSLGDGFTHDGNPNFTFDEGFGSEALFNGVWSEEDPRVGDWEFHILNVDTASVVPVPAAAWLFISALGGLVVAKRKQLKAITPSLV